ncbi:hypothetical protein HMPREF3166_01940 [Corynebacterium sp. HMSC08A12]|uniref:hypothetical protein n=1 Tax=Corynebacterium sp. HMSC08A12 TaxID=1581134 RepID=UPI0008A540A3|nr:hypothetical protein [Corynebacterium sp. HMSC08A12]OFT35946.1 hypothetical protein HMPREF3166_01940 [Corynebacterium sp. HMSC08A12]
MEGFDLQEYFSKQSFDQMNSQVSVADNRMRKFFIPTRDSRSIDNLMYNTPVTVAEATMPLASLISAFQGDDSAPLAVAGSWENAAKALKDSMDNLKSASTGLASSSEGYSFDTAREAIDDVHKTGLVVASNTTAMAGSVRQFPLVRSTNLQALETIQATTSLIADPAERLLAEQAAVANFVSSQLQPSLEMVRPPVSNLGVPIVGHSGGGTLDATTVSTASAQPTVTHINGHTNAVAPASAAAHGEQAANAATNAPKPAAAPAATHAAPAPGGLHAPANTPAPVQPAAATAAPQAPGFAPGGITSPAQAPTITPHQAATAAATPTVPGQGGTSMPGTENLINAQNRFGAGNGAARRSGTVSELGTRGNDPQLRSISGGAGAGTGANSVTGTPKADLRNVSTTAPRPNLPGSLKAISTPLSAPYGENAHANTPNSGKGATSAVHGATGAKGGVGMKSGGNVASTAMGRGTSIGRAGKGTKSGLRGSAVTFGKQDRSYFRRIFLSGEDPLISGKKARDRKSRGKDRATAQQTVKKVIR